MHITELFENFRPPRVTVNPTHTQLLGLLKTSARNAKYEYAGEPGSLRGVVTPDRLMVWDAYKATHDMMGYGDIRDGDEVYLIEIDERGIHWSGTRTARRALLANVHLLRAFGGNSPPLLSYNI